MLASLMILGAGCGKTDDRPYVWAYLSPVIFQPQCATASCHSRGAAVAGLDFSTPERGYRSLTGLHSWVATPSASPTDPSCQQAGSTWLCAEARPFVVPYAPGESRLVAMLRAHDAPRMPPDRPLPEPDIRLVERWILNGASETGGVASVLDASASGSDAAPKDAAASDGLGGAPEDGGDGGATDGVALRDGGGLATDGKAASEAGASDAGSPDAGGGT